MTRFRTRVLSAAALATLVLPTYSQTPPAESAPPPAFLGQLPATGRNVLVVDDPLPHLKAILNDPRFRKVFSTGKIAKLMADQGRPADLDQILRQLDQISLYVPVEVAVAFPDHAWADAGHLARFGIVEALAQSLADSGDDDAAKTEGPKLRAAALDELKALQLPSFTLWIKPRDAQTAAMVMGMIKSQCGQINGPIGDALTVGDNEVHFHTRLGALRDKESLAQALVQLKLIDDPDAAASGKDGSDLVEAMASRVIDLRLTQVADGLKLTVGPVEAKTLTAADLGPVFHTGPAEMMFETVHNAAAREAVTGVNAFWKTWAGTPEGRHLVEKGGSYAAQVKGNMIHSLDSMEQQFNNAGDQRTARLYRDQALHGETVETHVPASADVRQAPWLKLIPPDAEAYSLEGNTSLGDALANAMEQLELRLAVNAPPAQNTLTGRKHRKSAEPDETPAEVAARSEEKFFHNFQAFRDLVRDHARGVFGPSSGLVADSTGRVRSLTLGAPGDLVTLKDLPVLEFAVACPSTDDAATQKFVQEAYADLLQGVYASAQVPLPENLPSVKPVDLGLNVPTYAFSGEWIEKLDPTHKPTFNLAGDLQPHYFVTDHMVVFSTSPALSKRMLAARAGATPVAPPPAAGTLIGFGRAPGHLLAASLSDVARWIDAGLKVNPSSTHTADTADARRGVDVLDGLAEYAELVDKLQWTVTQQNGDRTTRTDLDLK